MVKLMVAFLEDYDVPRFPDGFYRGIVHPRQKYDLFTDTSNGGWMDANKYTDAGPLLAGEAGSYGGVKFLTSTICTTFATAGASGKDVIQATFFGPSAYAIGDMQTLEARFVPPGGDHSDPLGQKAIVGAKVAMGAGLLDANGARYVNLETAATIIKATGEA